VTHQYGVPMKDFLLATDALISAATPKSADRQTEGRQKAIFKRFMEY